MKIEDVIADAIFKATYDLKGKRILSSSTVLAEYIAQALRESGMVMEWVDAKERLPEPNTRVLFRLFEPEKVDLFTIGQIQADGSWWTETCTGKELKHLTHWLPIIAPKGKE